MRKMLISRPHCSLVTFRSSRIWRLDRDQDVAVEVVEQIHREQDDEGRHRAAGRPLGQSDFRCFVVTRVDHDQGPFRIGTLTTRTG